MKTSFKKVTANLLKSLDEKTSNIIERRFGLKSGKAETLESIGRDHGVTRERVRQIEKEGFNLVREKSKKYSQLFNSFNKTLDSLGGFKREDALLSSLGKQRNESYFLLSLNEDLKRIPESENFHSFWIKRDKDKREIEKAFSLAVKELKREGASLSGEELYSRLKGKTCLDKKAFVSSLEISKEIGENPDGKYGLKGWVEISPRGIKDKAYLVLRREENPLHFTRIASNIEKFSFFKDQKVHTATVHNELIKDSRFVLVGRGMYALKEWGYEPGVVKEIIFKVLKNSKKPLSKEEVLEEVSKQRYVKENTVFLNLHDRKNFERDSQGRYTVKES